MRRRLILVFLAVSSLVAVAFVVPLGFLVRSTAEDRAIDAARADAAAVVPTLVGGGTRAQIGSALEATKAGRDGTMTVVTSQGWTIGSELGSSVRVEAALTSGASAVGDVAGGVEVVAAVATGPGELSAIRVFVPDAELHRGQWKAWAALAAVGTALVAISVVVADRLALTIVRPTRKLAVAAGRLGEGHLDVTVQPDGPPELVELGTAFNNLGGRVSTMLERERELVAELSHRLRTPLTKLRMRVERVSNDDLATELFSDIDSMTGVINELIREARGVIGSDLGADLGEVVVERAEFWGVLAEDQQRAWQFEQGQGELRIPVGRADLAAAIDVLLENVFAHTDEGVAVEVGFGARDGFAQVWVGDAGSGFDSTSIERGESPAGSTGLGLDIARRTATEAGGSLEVTRSRLGGALVTVSLPLLGAQ